MPRTPPRDQDLSSPTSLQAIAPALGQAARRLAGAPASGIIPKAAGRAPRASLLVRHAAAAAAEPRAYEAPKELHGFELVREKFVAEYDSQVLMYRHRKTGAEVMSLVCKDENKTFGAVFRTPPNDSTGVPHILEHSVLCGSRKYPIKEPFNELMKGSMYTFLNAFTYPDRTCYPVASTNTQDFYNLVDVYLDAVLHPKCVSDEMTFAQEGWHLELDNKDEDVTLKGVVFNEMKGVYSQPDSVFYRAVQNALFPDNVYGVDSGGDPLVIPDLTFDEFRSFHQKYYHPSNGRFWFYGDDEPEKRLEVLGKFLDEFEPIDPNSTIPLHKKFPEPKVVTQHYAAGASDEEGGEGESKAFASVNWLMTEHDLDLQTELALGFLDYLMTGTAASPLRKALNDSGLGESIVGGGMDDELRQPVYSMGLKGVDPADVDKVDALILSELERLSVEGFPDSAIEAAINTIEFSLRENNTGRFPRGLSLMLRAVGRWLYERDAFEALEWQEPLAEFKASLEKDKNIFGKLIKQFLLDNPHRVSVRLLPDFELGKKQEAEEKGRIAKATEGWGDAEREALVEKTRTLKERQEKPDNPEALKCIPSLSLSDLPREASKVPTAIAEEQGATVLRHDLFTNNVLYAEMALDMQGVPADLLPLVPLFCRCLTQMGTADESFIELTERIGRKTGGLSVSPFISDVRGQKEAAAYIMVRGKAMGDKAGDLTQLIRDVLVSARLDDKARFTQMVLETRAGLEAAMVGSGHSIAASRLDAQRSVAGWASEATGGFTYLESIRALAKRVESDWDSVQADLESIRKHLLQRSGAIINLTADEATLSAAAPHVSELLSALPGQAALSGGGWAPELVRSNEALIVPTQVNYVGKAGNLYEDAGYDLAGAAYVINKHIGNSYLWDKVRVVGGAYGGFCDFSPHNGMFTYLSYRDPNVLSTVEAYDGTADWLRKTDLDKDALTKIIIGTVGEIDGYQLPDAKGYTAMMRHILKVSDAERQERREQILSTGVQDFRKFADYLDAVRESGNVVAVCSQDAADKALAKRAGLFDKVTKVL